MKALPWNNFILLYSKQSTLLQVREQQDIWRLWSHSDKRRMQNLDYRCKVCNIPVWGNYKLHAASKKVWAQLSFTVSVFKQSFPGMQEPSRRCKRRWRDENHVLRELLWCRPLQLKSQVWYFRSAYGDNIARLCRLHVLLERFLSYFL